MINELPKNLRRKKLGSKWQWVWGTWTSAAFDELEVRPWTPLIIGERLCFSAKNNDKWYMVFGDEISPGYDDVYDTIKWHEKPLYIARQDNNWFLVWGSKCSQVFAHQINFMTTENTVLIKPFKQDRWNDWTHAVEAQWR